MLPVPGTECFLLETVPSKVVNSATHEAPPLLSLIVIHSLSHPQVQSLYLVELWQLSIRSLCAPHLRIWQKQLSIFEGSDSLHRCGVPPVLISVGISRSQHSFLRMRGLPSRSNLSQLDTPIVLCGTKLHSQRRSTPYKLWGGI